MKSIANSARTLPLVLLFLCLVVAACGRNGTTETPPAAETVMETSAAAVLDTSETPQPSNTGNDIDSAVDTVADTAERPAATLEPNARNNMYTDPPEMVINLDKVYYATVETAKGDIEIQLFGKRAPKTVNNFVFLARQGFYDNVTFFRVLDGFMAQAGDPKNDGSGGPGYTFEDEFVPGLGFDQSGLLAMANRGPATNGSQFFITFAPAEWLTGVHTVFGKVINGEEVLGQLTRRDPRENPDFEGDKILRITIQEREESVLPTPTPAPPTPTPTSTPTPYAPTELDSSGRPLAERPLDERVNIFNIPPEMVIDATQQYTATISTSKGDMVATLYADQAPRAVNNFVVLANLGFYDNTGVNLVIPEDSIVIGAPDNNSLNDAGYRFPAEIGVDAPTDVGAMAYIRFEQQASGEILSSSSQILIALIDPPPAANMQFSFFAQIVDGVDILPQLTTEDTIESITITTGPAPES